MIEINKRVAALLSVSILLIASCMEKEGQSAGQSADVKSPSLMTKVINSDENADDQSILLFLDEAAASKVSDGIYDDVFQDVCADLDVKSVKNLFPNSGTDYARSHGIHRWFIVTFEHPVNVTAAAEKFSASSDVSRIQFNTKFQRSFGSQGTSWKPYGNYGDFGLPFDDPMLVDQWHYINNVDLSVAQTSRAGADINVKDAWRLTGGDPRVIVAVCDEGVKYSHPDLAANMWVNEAEKNGKPEVDDDANGYVDDIYGYNFLSTEDYPKEISWTEEGDRGHGTHVAGTIAAVNNNGIGVSGVAGGTGNGDGVRIMSCQVFSGNYSATVDDRALAYHYAADMGASILQCSFGLSGGMVTSDGEFDTVYGVEAAALAYFMDKPRDPDAKNPSQSPVDRNFVIFAAGNDGYEMAGYPAAHRDYISVSAFGPDYLPASYTNYGPGTNIAAPGGDISINTTTTAERAQILSTVPSDCDMYDSDYGWMQGTSMACPHVSGVVALGLSYALKLGKKFTYDDFLGIIYTSVNNLDYYIETSTKKSYGIDFDLTPYWKNMGTGAIDTWKLLMNIEGVPYAVAQCGEESLISLDDYFGNSASYLTFTKIEIDDESRAALDIEGEPYIKNGRLVIKCNALGSAKLRIHAIAGGDSTGSDSGIGGSEFSREISVLSREVALAENGGWL